MQIQEVMFKREDQVKNYGVYDFLNDPDFDVKNLGAFNDKGSYKMIKWSIHEDITTVSICATRIGTPKYIKGRLTNIRQNGQ